MRVSDKWVHDYATGAGWDTVTRELAQDLADARAALRDLVDYSDITKHVDADAVTERVKRARAVLGLTTETGPK